MTKTLAFNFNDSSIACAYDDHLVPVLFRPWATRIIEELPEWEGKSVLDLATGTGVVAHTVAQRVGAQGSVIAADINPEMLEFARRRCAEQAATLTFVESPAHPLDVESGAVDVVVCQQGFQFFPDRQAAAAEIYRVLRPRGHVLVSTWRSTAECELFGAIRRALTMVGELELAEMIRLPFDHMPSEDLASHFDAAGFNDVVVQRQAHELVLDGGAEQAIEVAYSTPIRPRLTALSEKKQVQFRSCLREQVSELSEDGITMGQMASTVLTATKP